MVTGTHQLQVRCRPGKFAVRRSETDVLPLSYTTNIHVGAHNLDSLFQTTTIRAFVWSSDGFEGPTKLLNGKARFVESQSVCSAPTNGCNLDLECNF